VLPQVHEFDCDAVGIQHQFRRRSEGQLELRRQHTLRAFHSLYTVMASTAGSDMVLSGKSTELIKYGPVNWAGPSFVFASRWAMGYLRWAEIHLGVHGHMHRTENKDETG
jgi:hypothetical protein